MDVLIVGASVRAAAHSARRAGLSPGAIDRFGDADLVAVAATERLPGAAFPGGLPDAAGRFPPGPFLFTGDLENHPEVVAAIARSRPLWGVGPATLAAVRDPLAVCDALRRAGLPGPDVRATAAGLPRDGSWLVKPLRSAGGLGIQQLRNGNTTDAGCYFQERREGRALGALYLAGRGEVELVGVVASRRGAPGEPFAYAGGVGPVPLDPGPERAIAAVGRALAAAFGLRGLFGVDLIERDGVPWPVEVNPRYTASVEILERATGRALLAEHRDAFVAGHRPPPPSRPSGRFHGKAIVYAPAAARFPARRATHIAPFPRFADLPAPGAELAAGDPVLTVFATGRTAAACAARLDRLVARWGRILSEKGEPFPRGSRTMRESRFDFSNGGDAGGRFSR
jgi:predicted ATP-grasp superfamily ATP-dependent carboligase